MNKRQDITGQIFGRLTVLGYSHSDAKTTYWKCHCMCGNEKVVPRARLIKGFTASCGCFRHEVAKRVRVKRNRVCSIPGCGKPHDSHGYCGMHAQRFRRYGDVNYITPDEIQSQHNRQAQILSHPASPKSYLKFFGRHEHRVVAESMIGRPLKRDEVVHHIDGNKHNNAPENLMVLTQSEHIKEHRQELADTKRKATEHLKLRTEKECRKCMQVKPLADFNKFARSPDGHQYWCRDCSNTNRAQVTK